MFGSPGTPIFEVGEKLGDFHNLPLVIIAQEEIQEDDPYFSDNIESNSVDTGDFTSGSENQQFARDPGSLKRDKAMDKAHVPDGCLEDLDPCDLAEIYRLRQGIVVTEVPDRNLLTWANCVIHLYSDNNEAIEWFSKRWKCPSCGNVHHDEDKPSKEPGICDRCGTDLVKLEKDDPQAVKDQLKNWKNLFWKFKETAIDGDMKYKMIDLAKCNNFRDILSNVNLCVRDMIEKEDWYAIARDGLEPLGINPHDGPFRWNPQQETFDKEERRPFH